MYLNEGLADHKYRVELIDVDQKTKKRLQDMGITIGGVVKVMFIVDTHVSIYKIRGSRVGLSKEITSKITVVEKVS